MLTKDYERMTATRYLSAKIRMNPRGYKVTDRLLFIGSDNAARAYSAFHRNFSTEWELHDILELSAGYSDAWFPGCGMTGDKVLESLRYNKAPYTFPFLFTKFNNMVVYVPALRHLCVIEAEERLFVESKDFDALMQLMVGVTSSDSITPYLPCLCMHVSENDPLHVVADMKHERESMAKSFVPAFGSDVRTAGVGNDYAMMVFDWNPNKIPDAEPNAAARRAIAAKLSFLYAMESLYVLSRDRFGDDMRQRITERLYSLGVTELPGLAHWKLTDPLELAPDFRACLSDKAADRYAAFREFLKARFDEAAWDKMLDCDALALFFKSCHNYAMLEYRKRYIQLMYVEAKRQGKLTKESMTRVMSNAGVSTGPASGSGTEPDPDTAPPLLDLGLDAYDDVEAKPSDPKDVHKTKSSGAPTLDALSILKSDLDSSPYTYSIVDVRHPASYADSYNSVSKKLNLLTNELIKSVREIKTYNFGGKNPGKSSGKLDAKSLCRYRTDHNIFYDTTYKVKEMDLAFGIILDESGSMAGSGVRDGRVAMIMLHEVCLALGIDHSVIGHTSHGTHDCVIHRYWNFNEDPKHTLDVPYGLAGIEAHSGNCDSGALFYMQTQMRLVPHKDKIVLIFSDGEPTECTDEELKRQIRAMEASGIHVIGIGIDFESIKEYYGDYANGRNMSDMVRIITEILQRYVLEKGD